MILFVSEVIAAGIIATVIVAAFISLLTELVERATSGRD